MSSLSVCAPSFRRLAVSTPEDNPRGGSSVVFYSMNKALVNARAFAVGQMKWIGFYFLLVFDNFKQIFQSSDN